MEITLIEKLGPISTVDGQSAWLKFKTDKGEMVVFWAHPMIDTRNVDMLNSLDLPIKVYITSPENCITSKYQREKYKASISVDCKEGLIIIKE